MNILSLGVIMEGKMNKHPLIFSLLASLLYVSFFTGLIYPVGKEVSLKFSDLRSWAENNSPIYQLIEEKNLLESVDTRIDFNLRASNPTFSYSNEYVNNDSLSEREQVFTLSKNFELPWIYSKRRQSYNFMENSLKFNKEANIREFISNMKSGYVALSLMNDKLDLFGKLKIPFQKVALTAKNRKENGLITGYEQNQIELAFLNLEGKILTLARQKREIEKNWMMEMGLDSETLFKLGTKIIYKPINMEQIKTDQILKQMPGFGQRELESRSLSTRLKMEKAGIISDVTFFAGYKKVTADLNGYTVGLSIGLPLLNHKQDLIKKRKLDLEIHEHSFSLFKKKNHMLLYEKVSALKEFMNLLTPMSAQFNLLKNQLEPVVSAYLEGVLSTTDFINILQTYISAVEQYHSNLINYFKTINQLEAMSGRKLIDF